jgi:hypothetical protein
LGACDGRFFLEGGAGRACFGLAAEAEQALQEMQETVAHGLTEILGCLWLQKI